MLRLSVTDWNWPMSEDDGLIVVTLKCGSCGNEWVVSETAEGDETHIKSDSGYRCAACGKKPVWQVGVRRIEPGQG
jgi:DNA-directed RNA polymerase subunit RPC12/RpoP